LSKTGPNALSPQLPSLVYFLLLVGPQSDPNCSITSGYLTPPLKHMEPLSLAQPLPHLQEVSLDCTPLPHPPTRENQEQFSAPFLCWGAVSSALSSSFSPSMIRCYDPPLDLAEPCRWRRTAASNTASGARFLGSNPASPLLPVGQVTNLSGLKTLTCAH
jgi:hypothetical protein